MSECSLRVERPFTRYIPRSGFVQGEEGEFPALIAFKPNCVFGAVLVVVSNTVPNFTVNNFHYVYWGTKANV